jgi:hypothetical protein
VGTKTDEQLKRELLNAKSFIALLTQHSLNSTWVLFELGARWGAERHLAPVFAAGLTAEQLRGPLPGITGLSCDSDNQIHQLVHDIAKVLGVGARKTHFYSTYVTALMKASSDAKERGLPDKAKSETQIREQRSDTETSLDRKIAIHHIVLETLKRDGTRNFWDSIKRGHPILWLHNYGSEAVRMVKVHDVKSASGRYTLVFDEIPVIAAGQDATLSYEILEDGKPVYFDSGKDALFAFFSDTNGSGDLTHKYWFGIFSVNMDNFNSFSGGTSLVRELPEMKLKVAR